MVHRSYRTYHPQQHLEQNPSIQHSNISAVRHEHLHPVQLAKPMSSSGPTQGGLHRPLRHDKTFQGAGLFGLQMRDVGSVIDFQLFLSLANIIVPVLYKKISIFFLKLYLHCKSIWQTLCLNYE